MSNWDLESIKYLLFRLRGYLQCTESPFFSKLCDRLCGLAIRLSLRDPEVKGVGSLLWNAVVDHLHLLEADYFDLEYTNHNGDECWLDKDKAIIKQIGSADTPLRFCVKFYTPDPGLLEDELTRSVVKSESVSLNLAVAHLGVLVFQHFTKINTFSWAKVRKLSFKRKKFLIKLHADTYGYYKDTVEFFFDSRDRCKLFWKRCIEHHAFFRCQVVAKVPRNKTRMVSRGSSFRYCGRTQKQLVEYVRENIGKRPHFERSTSGRISSRSASVTPKISSKPGMHSSSADLHTSSGSRSSGSHILESNHTPGTRSNRDSSGAISAMREHSGASSAMRGGVESVDVHSDSSMSGSRSLNSPRLEHGLSIDQEVIEAVNARTEGAMTDDDDEEAADSSSHRHPVMAHVSSETKGASSSPSPPVYTEQSSPVRYVGLYSEAVDITPDLPTTTGISAATSVVSDSKKREYSDSLLANTSSSPNSSNTAGNAVTCIERGSQSVCLPDGDQASMSSVVNRSSSPALRSNLNLNLTNITRSSSPSSLSQPPSSSVLLSSVCPPASASSSSSSATAAPQSPSSTLPSAQQHTTITTAVPPTFTSTPLSASQNMGNVCHSHSAKQTLSESSMRVKSRSSTPLGVDDGMSGRGVPARLQQHQNKQVSETAALGQQQQQPEELRQQPRPDRESAVKPFSPLYNSDVAMEITAAVEGSAHRRIVASPSSCVTDFAETLEGAEQRQYHQVRLASSSSRFSPLDSDKSTPGRSAPTSPGHRGAGQPGDNFAAKASTLASPGSRVESRGAAENMESEQLFGSLDGSGRKKKPSRADASGRSKTSTSPASPGGLTKLKDGRTNFSNGAAVGAGAPPTRHLEAELTSGPRKLSAGADLIEDIPYILHRRQDGQREETSVFKSSRNESRVGARQYSRSVSPQQRCSSLSSTPTPPQVPGSALRSRQRSEHVPRPNSVPASVPSNSGAKERSRRLEFINVHKLPSRLSYSSVDDTTSPSGDQGILKSLDHSANEKTEATRQNHSQVGTPPTAENTQKSQSSEVKTDHKPDASKSDTGHSVASSQVAPTSATAESPSALNSESDSSALSPGVQFYSPKLPGSQRLTLAVGASISDESPDRCEGLHGTRVSVSSAASLENVADLVSDQGKSGVNESDLGPNSKPQYFEVSKPQPHHGQEKACSSGRVGSKDVPKSLPIKSLHVKPSDLPLATAEGSHLTADTRSEGQRQPVSAPQRGSSLSVGRRVSNGSETNQFLIDLPSPAAALFYSENNCDSPPAAKKDADDSTGNLTFSTFRPEDAEEDAYLKAEAAARSRLKSPVRWALQQSAREAHEASDYKVIMTEGIVEKSALKKKKSSDERDKPREPKRVSWHEDGDLEHSYHSDMGANAEGADDDDDSSSYPTSTGISSLVNSADIMETLENLRNQHSESDLTNSGSSVSCSETGSDEEADDINGNQVPQGQPQISADYDDVHEGRRGSAPTPGVASRGLGLRTSSIGQEKHNSPLTSSRGSDRIGAQDASPLEPLEKLCLSMNSDNFDDEGEADDEDDEPNFPPPPPPIVNLPEEMLQSYESDLPLPDMNSGMLACGMQDPPDFLQNQGLPQAPVIPGAGACSSDSDTDHKSKSMRADSSCGLARFLPRQASPRLSLDPLAQLEFGDLVADMHCTTSESESDFDAEEANSNIRRLSAVITPLGYAGAGSATASLEKSLQHGLPLYSENPSHRAQLQQQQQQQHTHRSPGPSTPDGAHVVQKSLPVSVSPSQLQAEVQPPKCYPKPARTKPKPPVPLPSHASPQPQPQAKQAPPPVYPRPGHLRQPQMGKGKQFDRIQRQKTSPTVKFPLGTRLNETHNGRCVGAVIDLKPVRYVEF
ncbi:FERM, RhoGEF and pleckstrin domain-containing protein 1-like [Elysia marginata]|uniref:FERM, RhoGEF and pleckstrin domain-containing protein 1-like n=1 Tax=Elysia marginata TaxID=1093978 RepID=A0AAV4G2H0_9GAST|nr:FERM, RhoGEF and pleckstrin domain-containing protein 1-like [Elysia marginata]